jgi:hypothetical protein
MADIAVPGAPLTPGSVPRGWSLARAGSIGARLPTSGCALPQPPCVELVPADQDAFLRRFSWLGRMGRNPRLGYPVVAIRGPLLPVGTDILVEQMRALWLRNRKDPDPG